MNKDKHFIIDFDSTFTKVEALDELCDISLGSNPEKEEILKQVQEITDLAMEGNLTFRESLKRRIELIKAHKDHLPILIERLKTLVSESFINNRIFFQEHAGEVFIISNGFKDFIEPIVLEYGIKSENIFANTFEFDEQGNITGFDKENPLSKSKGKKKLRKFMRKEGMLIIGDGHNDYEIKEAGFPDKFYAFTENIERTVVTKKADHIAPSFDEILYVNKLPMQTSYPKSRIKILLLENVHPKAKAFFKDAGYHNVEILSSALDEEELSEKIKDVHILGIRSKTQVTRKSLENADKLMAIGTFCIGTNQVDLDACMEKGVAVFNAPFSNTRSVVELAMGEIIMLMRRIPAYVYEMRQGIWNKSASNSFEVRGKKLGIVGYGNIGSQLSIIAESMGMKVYYYDLVEKLALGNATKCSSIEELLNKCDVVSLHVDGRAENKDKFGEEYLNQMKDGAILLNLSRGFVVDIKALAHNLTTGKLKGAAIDVFPTEPKNNEEPFVSMLRKVPNLILTPHIGGSTMEAQENIAEFVPGKLIQYINTGNTFNSVNFPNVQLPVLENAHRLLHIHKNEPGMLAKIDSVIAKHNINIVGQYLKTNEDVGYVIMDINKEYNPEVLNDLKAIKNTIKFRKLY